MLWIHDLHATAAGKPILSGLSLAVDAGELRTLTSYSRKSGH
jgi:Fe-S cluster assembly ATPase SufC